MRLRLTVLALTLTLLLPQLAAAQVVPVLPNASTALEASHIAKSTSARVTGASVTTGATGGYLMLFNANSVPADGAVTPAKCVYAPANNTTSISADPGTWWNFQSGLVLVFSTTGCLTKTASATVTFNWSEQ